MQMGDLDFTETKEETSEKELIFAQPQEDLLDSLELSTQPSQEYA
jgi:hypothetical protein